MLGTILHRSILERCPWPPFWQKTNSSCSFPGCGVCPVSSQSTDFPSSRLAFKPAHRIGSNLLKRSTPSRRNRYGIQNFHIGRLWQCAHGQILPFTGALASGLISSGTASRSLSSLSKGATIFRHSTSRSTRAICSSFSVRTSNISFNEFPLLSF
jgi:hypothetical protein